MNKKDEHRTSNDEWEKGKQRFKTLKDEHRTSNVQHRMLNEKRGNRRIN